MLGCMPAKPRQFGLKAEGAYLDSVNRRLLAELQRDARLSLAELGRRVSLSSPAVAERMQRLEEAGVITGYHVAIDPRALGYALGAVVRVRPGPGQLPRIAAIARDTVEVVECHRITGEDCYFMKVHVRSLEHLEEVIDRFTGYGQTTTSLIQSSPVVARGVSLDSERSDQAEAG
jgi:Lrp/AsnC family leucine-responsive transcriptional regulator